MPKKIKPYRQLDNKDCGATCLKIICNYYGRDYSLNELLLLTETQRTGTSVLNLSDAAEKIGFRTLCVKIDFIQFKKDILLPCIIHWQQNHFVVVYKISKKYVFVVDPAHGLIKYKVSDFIKLWINETANEITKEGIVLILEPTIRLNQTKPENHESKQGFLFLFQYLIRYKKFLTQLIIGLIAGSLLQLIFPFLTQSIVDLGIQNQDINFIYLILIAQLFLFVGRTSIEIIRGWILLHLSMRINISLLSDFFIKLMNLPISFFDSKITGDIMQRINDHQRIENLLTNSSLNVLFSLFNLLIFGLVLAWYNINIFLVFLVGSILFFLWVVLFLKKRKDLDYKRFSQMSIEQSNVIEMISGMQEVKLHNAEKQKRWKWENLQIRLFRIETKSLVLEQIQTTGSNVINELKNIFITILSAKLVIDGEITLGMMMAISYIIGQLNSPIQQLIGFVYIVQDAKIALERLSEIHNKEDEDSKCSTFDDLDDSENLDIILKDVYFRYPGSSEMVLKGINMTIPENKVTAIVGTSGSGKTTLLKMLLKFYEPYKGDIKIGDRNLGSIANKQWRHKIGTVMQNGYIFNDSIVNNIALGEISVDKFKLRKAIKTANIKAYIDQLPLRYNTIIGDEGLGMSTGQKQRLLIARAVYKDPEFIFFDEATSALDANNEKIIMENLDTFFKDRTAVVIAHRLSTVKNADQIVVLEFGEIVESGTHKELVDLKGRYYELVKNQLELN